MLALGVVMSFTAGEIPPFQVPLQVKQPEAGCEEGEKDKVGKRQRHTDSSQPAGFGRKLCQSFACLPCFLLGNYVSQSPLSSGF